jgi:hypothetical protein
MEYFRHRICSMLFPPSITRSSRDAPFAFLGPLASVQAALSGAWRRKKGKNPKISSPLVVALPLLGSRAK